MVIFYVVNGLHLILVLRHFTIWIRLLQKKKRKRRGGGGGMGGKERERERVLNDQNAKCNHSFRLPIDGHGLFKIVLQSLFVQFLYPSQCFHRQCRQRVADNECVRGGIHWFRFQTAGHTRPHVQQVLYSLLAFLVPACKVGVNYTISVVYAFHGYCHTPNYH